MLVSAELETPYIRWTHETENGRQGDVLPHFYGEKQGRKMLFDGCDIPVTTIPQPLSVPERYAVAPTFLAIPIPRKLMPSYGICNARPVG